MTQQEIQNEIINKIISPLMGAALKQHASEQLYKEKKISYEEIQFPLRDYLNSIDSNSKRETFYCIEWYQEFLKKTILYMKGDLDIHEGSLSDTEYLDAVDSDLINVEFNIDIKKKYESNTKMGSPLSIKNQYNISDDIMPTKINAVRLAKAIKDNDPNVAAAISAGAITITEDKTRKFKVSIKEDNE